jgi:hypothetical protein
VAGIVIGGLVVAAVFRMVQYVCSICFLHGTVCMQHLFFAWCSIYVVFVFRMVQYVCSICFSHGAVCMQYFFPAWYSMYAVFVYLSTHTY